MWIRKDNSRGAWFYDGEIEIGYSAALRTAATIVTEDPLFGLFAYGGLLSETDGGVEVIPRDGLRKCFHVIRGERRLHMLLDRDGFAAGQPIVVNDELHDIRFTLENRAQDRHVAILRLAGLPDGDYNVHIDGELADRISSRGDEWITVDLPISLENVHNVEIRFIKDAVPNDVQS
jgi:hypothetical protein